MPALAPLFPDGFETATESGPVQIDGLACERALMPVFDNLSLRVEAGQALALYGPNGSGKTSLLRILAGLLPPSAGLISPPPNPQDLHYLGHADGLKPLLSVGETLDVLAGLFGITPYDTHDILACLGLSGRGGQAVGDLSAGQRRRLGLARLLVAPRPLWLLDEPLTALDTQGRALVDELARAHLAAKGMIIAASHEVLDFATERLSLGPLTSDPLPSDKGGA